MRARADRISVVVPAHNEQVRLPRCLAALGVAAGNVDVPVEVVVVVDACTDATAAVVAEAAFGGIARLRTVHATVRNVGSARELGARAALTGGLAARWLAMTDADSAVPPNWLRSQLRHAELGATVVVGTVRVIDWSEHPPGTETAYLRNYRFRAGHGHTHGANLSMWAGSYLRVGGFAALRTGEDVELVRRLVAAGESVVWAADLAVVTSARRAGRAPSGFAEHLRHAAAPLEEAGVG